MAGYETSSVYTPAILLFTLCVGLTLLALLWIWGRISNSSSEETLETGPSKEEKVKESESTATQGNKSKKKGPEKRVKTAPNKLPTHPHQYAVLKGHSASVRSFDISANGKYIITAAEDGGNNLYTSAQQSFSSLPLEPGGALAHLGISRRRLPTLPLIPTSREMDGDTSSETSTNNCSTSTEDHSLSDDSIVVSPQGYKQSLRQKKNKKRKNTLKSSETKLLFKALNLKEKQLLEGMVPFCVPYKYRMLNGFPFQADNGVYIYKSCGAGTTFNDMTIGFNRIQESMEWESFDFDQSSSTDSCIMPNSSENGESLGEGLEPELIEDDPASLVIDGEEHPGDFIEQNNNSKNEDDHNRVGPISHVGLLRFSEPRYRCVRCREAFCIKENLKSKYDCHYHPLKLTQRRDKTMRYQCCNSYKDSKGCKALNRHVYMKMNPGVNGPLVGFKATQELGHSKVYGLDCEMVFTEHGFEVAKVSLVKVTGEAALDVYVKPVGQVLDYNTPFSGVREEHLEGAMSFSEMQSKMLSMVSKSSVLVGHSMESDLACLRIIHRRVIDTALCFRQQLPTRPLPALADNICYVPAKKPGLKRLVLWHLKKDIQQGEGGHDSFEDACAALNLVLHWAKLNFSGGKDTLAGKLR
ncbi:uncharacterized protein LOC143024872 isoform X1 [Oratosquilla oratoria]|uniref:uncharacterized protein LOC143024872 isoform X1 n=1 Tax=Oratosquilla oratoria TaxID=337810 RepID=UPI003F7705E5